MKILGDAPSSDASATVWVVMATSGEYSDRVEWPDLAYTDEASAKDRVAFLTRSFREVWANGPECPRFSEDDTAWVKFRADQDACVARMKATTGAVIDADRADTTWFVYEVPLAGKSRDGASLQTPQPGA